MMNPDMMRMATEMMSKMTPEQIAAMQRQAANMPPDMMQQAMAMAQNATPEQIAQMRAAAASVTPDVLAAQAGAAASSMGAQQPQQGLGGAAALKAEGNRLHGAKQWRAAAEKYERALQSIEGDTSPQARELRTSCHSNLASCFLQLADWQRCVEQCGTVLAGDANNRKALYRRGQALCSLGCYAAAVEDLQQAVTLSPEGEKDLIRDKLAEAKQGLQHTEQGVVIEEVTEPAAAPAPTPPATQQQQQQQQQQRGQQEGLTAESDDDDDMPALEELAQPAGGAAAVPTAPTAAPVAAPAAVAAAGAGAALPPFMPPGMDPSRMQQAQEMLQKNPDMARQAAAAMSAMSAEQIASMVAQSGMPGVTPEMAKQAAAMMRSMPPKQLSAMAQTQLGAGGMGGGAAPASAAAVPPPAAALAGPAMPGMHAGDMAAATEALQKDPAMMKQAASMLENMSEEQLRGMAAAMPGAAGMQIDPAQMKMAAKMMATMSPEDMERMQRMAASMGMASSGSGGAAPAGVGATTGGAGGVAAAGPSAVAAGGMPAAFDPASMPPDMMADMRKRMQDPEMLKKMKGMLKGMDPQSLADVMKQSGMNVSPEQAQSMVNSLDKVSDKHLELIARLMAWVNTVIGAWRTAKAWVMSQGALALALLILLVAVLLRWLGWI
ncbi:outer envelope 61-like [Micractinium conductrix]|uniref:Outer envelope 61-like n=1 Tax=Micractinium conductrix TaxID=554055 RepID=A0A2P6VBH8_9CHLO|nr:outer envelope 61-like [Micractinium conductrix]|eukprot:PSC71444.1 outer envelope 61-like [Micractinium conductrix]